MNAHHENSILFVSITAVLLALIGAVTYYKLEELRLGRESRSDQSDYRITPGIINITPALPGPIPTCTLPSGLLSTQCDAGVPY